MMDVVPLPERKKPNFLRATKEQLDILMAGFAVSDISSKPHLTALSEATDLPVKWIASWFTRQRKKVANASGRVDIQDNVTTDTVKSRQDPATAAAMSVQEIAAFKTEYNETAFMETLALPADSEPEQKPVPSEKSIKMTSKTTKKRRSKPTPYPAPPSSPLKPPFVSAPLPSRSALSSSEYHSLEAQPQPTDHASQSSTFILREMVPVAYKPKTINESISSPANAIKTPPSESSEIVSPSLSPGHITLAIQKPQESLNGSNSLKPCDAQKKSIPRIDRPLRPLLPLNAPPWNTVPASHQYLHNYSQAVLGIPQTKDDTNTKENRLIHPQRTPHTSTKLRSSGPRTLPPLFTTADLTLTKARQSIQSTTNGADPTSVATCTQISQQNFLVTDSAHLSLEAQDENEVRFDDQPGSFFDTTIAPLKYLDVLVPFPDESLTMDEMMSRVLDPQLAEEDPFQAAMGLVFASQLGLNWDYT